MQKQRIAIVGLGRVGSIFLDVLLKQQGEALDIVAVAESNATPGRTKAQNAGVAVLTMPDLLKRCGEIDIVFDLTGAAEVRRQLRDGLAASGNRNTVIAPESVARLIWALVAPDGELPDVHAPSGY